MAAKVRLMEAALLVLAVPLGVGTFLVRRATMTAVARARRTVEVREMQMAAAKVAVTATAVAERVTVETGRVMA